jgi:tetratricopeptide (TPR) repeat protein
MLVFLSCREKNPGTKKEKESSPNNTLASVDPGLPDSVREGNILILIDQSKYIDAIDQADILLKKNPEHPAWLYLKANALEYLGDTSLAIDIYEKAIHSAGSFTEAAGHLANLYAEKADARSIPICESLLKDPTAVNRRSDILLIKSIYFQRSGKKDQAIEQLNQIIREDYTYLDAYIEKGLLLFDQHQYQEAWKVFEKSTSVKNSFADGYFWMARCEEKMNQKVAAIDNYKRALALDTGFTEARIELKRLGSLQ